MKIILPRNNRKMTKINSEEIRATIKVLKVFKRISKAEDNLFLDLEDLIECLESFPR